MASTPPFNPAGLDPEKLQEKLLDAISNIELEQEKGRIAADKARLDRGFAAEKEENDADLAAEEAERTKDLELRGLFHQKIMEVAGGAIDRARDSAKFVQTAAAALMTAYAALLGLVFSASGRPLPLRGVYAAVFLGLAIALAVAYLAFIKRGQAVEAYQPDVSYATTELARTQSLIDWVNASVANRRNAMRAGVVAFALGVAFIPAAFVGATGGSASTATAQPTAPTIPRSVPGAVSGDAARLFKDQVDRYLAAVREQTAAKATAAAAKPTVACSGFGDLFKACAWTTENGVERSFRRLFYLGILVLILIPIAVTLYERQKRPA
jgi:hypothetical protein